MKKATSSLVGIVEVGAFVAGIIFFLDGILVGGEAKTIMHQIYAGLSWVGSIISFGVFAVTALLKGILKSMEAKQYVASLNLPGGLGEL